VTGEDPVLWMPSILGSGRQPCTPADGKGCADVRRLDDVDRNALRELVEVAWSDNHTPR
jgi:hypothetical protein